jgi:hypothetical protein
MGPEQELHPARVVLPQVHHGRVVAVEEVLAPRKGRLGGPEEDVLERVAALERVGLVDLREVVAELEGVAEPLADHPAVMAEPPEPRGLDPRQAAVARELRDSQDAVLGWDIARVVAVGLEPIRALAAEPEARLVDEARREHVRVAEGEAVDAHGLRALGEAAAVGIALEGRRPQLVVVGEAVACEHPIVLAEVVVHAHVEGVRVVGVGPVHDVVVVQPRQGGFRIEHHQPEGVGVDPADGDDVARERIADVARGRDDAAGDRIDLSDLELAGGGGIEDRAAGERAAEDVGADGAALQRDEVREVGEPAGALARRGHGLVPDPGLLDERPLVVGEPEGLAFRDRAARGEAELVGLVLALRHARPVREEVVGVEAVVAVELPGAAVELVAPRFERGVEHRAAGAAVLGAERAGEDLELGDGVDGRLDHVGHAAQEVDVAVVVVDAVEQVVVLGRLDAVGGEHERGARADVRRDDSRRQSGEKGVVTTVERQVVDDVARDNLAEGAGLRLEQGGVGRHLHRLGHVSGSEGEVHHGLLLDVQRDPASERLLEAGELHRHAVAADLDRREDVGAVRPRHRRQREGLSLVGEGDLGSGKDGPRRVLDGAQDRTRVDLGQGGGPQKAQGQRLHRTEGTPLESTHGKSPLPHVGIAPYPCTRRRRRKNGDSRLGRIVFISLDTLAGQPDRASRPFLTLLEAVCFSACNSRSGKRGAEGEGTRG